MGKDTDVFYRLEETLLVQTTKTVRKALIVLTSLGATIEMPVFVDFFMTELGYRLNVDKTSYVADPSINPLVRSQNIVKFYNGIPNRKREDLPMDLTSEDLLFILVYRYAVEVLNLDINPREFLDGMAELQGYVWDENMKNYVTIV